MYLFMHDMNDMLHPKKKKTKSHKFIYECILFFVKQNSDLLLW